MNKCFEGLKVIDLTSALNGPFCTMFLADYGAEVIKIEPLGGEQCRTWGPFEEKSGESAFFASFNRNKKGCTLNLKTEKGRQMLYDLVKDADVLVENYKGGVTKKLKIDYDTIKEINPEIIYASGSGFGQYGPISHRPAYDIVAQAMGGMLYLTGFKENESPVKVGPSVADHVSGIYLCVGTLMALYYKEKTGKGQHIDVSMMDVMFSILENAIVNYTVGGEIPERNGNIDPSIAPFDVYPCKDGYVALGVGNDRLFAKMADAMGMPEMADVPEYATNDLRQTNYVSMLKPVLTEWCEKYTKKEIEALMDEYGVPCGPVLNVKEIIEHPQCKAREMIVTMDHPTAGKMDVQGVVCKLSETPGGIWAPSPLVGEHNREVFGLTEEEEKQLQEEGVI